MPYTVTITFDHANLIATATTLGVTRTAHVDGDNGCVLDPTM